VEMTSMELGQFLLFSRLAPSDTVRFRFME
jgi:hypothetical protein